MSRKLCQRISYKLLSKDLEKYELFNKNQGMINLLILMVKLRDFNNIYKDIQKDDCMYYLELSLQENVLFYSIS